ncbi:asparagine synthase (glutamine-hydrolyzing) [Duganella sp. 1411]|nr:asparagine synthase (glutamine-hydrolyzing) [Duganella sp. 1411]
MINNGAPQCDNSVALAAAFRYIDGRGPDARGARQIAYRGRAVTLAHSRLAVIELSALGAQPMVDADSGWSIVYNGEIYNYREIRATLNGAGQAFNGGSDTEVLLRAWALWGLGALSRLNGMFAFAALNEKTGELWLVRDRFGVKPLLWGRCPNGDIVFGSSVASVASMVGTDIDTAYCARGVRYKAYETAQSGSPYKHVNAVAAGCWIKFQLSPERINVSEGRWYSLRDAVAQRQAAMADSSDADLLEECRQLFDSAVQLRLRSDVPVAVSLSAGLDSASIACMMQRHGARTHAFSFGAPSEPASEGPGTQSLAKAAGIDVTYVWPRYSSWDLYEMLEKTMAFQEAPFSGLSPIAQNAVFRAVGDAGFKVLLGGQGSDEIFAGYRKFIVIALREALRRREAAGALRLMYSLALMLAHEASQARMYWQNLGRYKDKASAFRLLDWEAGAHNLWGEAGMSLADRQIEDIQQWSLPTLLRYEDRNSMGYGIETRLPFMDYRLIEFALALPTRMKIANGYGKWLLRGAAKGLVPDVVRLNRKKRGFDVTQNWITQGIGASLRGFIFDHSAALRGALKTGEQLDKLLSNESLAQDPDLLDEALLLAWLVDPTRLPRHHARPSRMAA